MTIHFLSILKNSNYKNLNDNFDKISYVQKLIARRFPFENIDVLLQNDAPITEQFLYEKMIEKDRGGLCYEQNGLLYILLKQLGFEVELASATMARGDDWATKGTHAVVLLKDEGKTYAVDSGAGSQLPLQPMLLDGPVVESQAGKFRFKTKKTAMGTLATERLTENGWSLWYAFKPNPISMEGLTKMKEVIHYNPKSSFRKQLLLAKVVADGTISINEERFYRKWVDGREQTVQFKSKDDIIRKLKKYASPNIVSVAQKYLNDLK